MVLPAGAGVAPAVLGAPAANAPRTPVAAYAVPRDQDAAGVRPKSRPARSTPTTAPLSSRLK